MSISLTGASSPFTPVDSDTSGQLKVALTDNEDLAGFAALTAEIDIGSADFATSRQLRAIETTQDYRLRASIDGLSFTDHFASATLNSSQYTAPVTTMTVTIVNGRLKLNAGLSTATATVARVSTYRAFPIYSNSGTIFSFTALRNQLPQVNNVTEIGAFIATASTAPTDGAFVRMTAAGTVRCVVSNNSIESASGDIAAGLATLWPVSTLVNFQIVFGEDAVIFWAAPQGGIPIKIAEIARPVGAGHTAAKSLPLSVRTYNTGTTAAAQVIEISHWGTTQQDYANPIAIRDVLALNNQSLYTGQQGWTLGTTGAGMANSTNAAAAVPTNTTAALAAGLGGIFWETDTLAVTTDGIILSFQNPAFSTVIPGKSIVVTGVRISTTVQTALTGGGYVAQWTLAYGHNSVSLATAASTTARAPVRVALGDQIVASGAAISTRVDSVIDVSFDGVVINPGEFVQVVKRKIGTAPSAGVLMHMIHLRGFVV